MMRRVNDAAPDSNHPLRTSARGLGTWDALGLFLGFGALAFLVFRDGLSGPFVSDDVPYYRSWRSRTSAANAERLVRRRTSAPADAAACVGGAFVSGGHSKICGAEVGPGNGS